MIKKCISCGMPMTKPSDYPLEDERKDYCTHCARPDGSMQSYDEKINSCTEFIIRTQGLDRQVAKGLAIRTLKNLPAWENC